MGCQGRLELNNCVQRRQNRMKHLNVSSIQVIPLYIPHTRPHHNTYQTTSHHTPHTITPHTRPHHTTHHTPDHVTPHTRPHHISDTPDLPLEGIVLLVDTQQTSECGHSQCCACTPEGGREGGRGEGKGGGGKGREGRREGGREGGR